MERWAEDSGNAALAGRELPPDQVLAADERITARARELKAAGVEGGLDELRAGALTGPAAGPGLPPGEDQGTRHGARACGVRQPGHADRPLATLTRLASRRGELAGLGAVDPWLTRDLAAAAARNPKTTWCLTVTDDEGHAVGHGCARPEPGSHGKRAGPARGTGRGSRSGPRPIPGPGGCAPPARDRT